MIQVAPILCNKQANKKILKQSSTHSKKAPRNLSMAFISLTLDAHDNGSSTCLKFGSLAHKNTQIKKFHNAIERMDKREFRIWSFQCSSLSFKHSKGMRPSCSLTFKHSKGMRPSCSSNSISIGKVLKSKSFCPFALGSHNQNKTSTIVYTQ